MASPDVQAVSGAGEDDQNILPHSLLDRVTLQAGDVPRPSPMVKEDPHALGGQGTKSVAHQSATSHSADGQPDGVTDGCSPPFGVRPRPGDVACGGTQHCDLRVHAEHLRMCSSCRMHNIKVYREEIIKLEEVDARDPLPKAEQNVNAEVGLTKISAAQLRQWERRELTEGSVLPGLLFTTDGADHGIRRSVEHDNGAGHKRQSTITPATASTTATDDIPFRLIFNSLDLVDLVEKITDADLPRSRPVHVRPFKFLLAHEFKLRASLEALRVASGHTEAVNARTTLGSDPGDLGTSCVIQSTATCKVMGIAATHRNVRLLECLVEFMEIHMRDIIGIRKKVEERTLSTISFEHLLHLYSPGDLVFTKSISQAEARQAYRVLFVTGGRPHFESKPEPNPARYPYYGQEKERGIRVGGITVFPQDSVSQGLQGRATTMTPLVLDCFFMDFDGTRYGPRPQRFIIPEFSGCRRITDLDVYPADFDPAVKPIRHALRRRGEEFIECAQGAHKEYHGRTLPDRTPIQNGPRRNWHPYEERAAKSEALQVDCECIIDQKAALDRFNPTQRDELEEITDANKLGFHTGVIARPTAPNPMECSDKEPGTYSTTEIYDDSKFDMDRRSRFLHLSTLLTTSTDIHEGQLELLPLRLFGYALQHRKWYAFNVLDLTDVKALQRSEEGGAFDDLVLPKEHKKTIKALVRHQVRGFRSTSETEECGGAGASGHGTHTFDLIHNKGRGLVILLHGAPGVGKTSTAESVAIQLKRPLLPITCGDLGTDVASTVETTLEYFLSLGTKWGCVVLLDEADVFLARRMTGDLKRNSLVSVFLRQMEFFSGVLILTTNRVGEFDEAFVSRIHMKLHYPTLDKDSSADIWKMNIRRISENKDLDIEIKANGIQSFAEEYWARNRTHPDRRWNGRQIKNAFQTAVALASWDYENAKADGKHREKPVLRKRHFEEVAKTSLHFDRYMDKIYGAVMPDGRRSKGAFVREAEKQRIRNDEDEFEEPEHEHSGQGFASGTRIAMKSRPHVTTDGGAGLADLQREISRLRKQAHEIPTQSQGEVDDDDEDDTDSDDIG